MTSRHPDVFADAGAQSTARQVLHTPTPNKGVLMAFQIKRKAPVNGALHTEDRYEDAIHLAQALIGERVLKARMTVTNLKTGETLTEAQIAEAALSIGPRKRRSKNA